MKKILVLLCLSLSAIGGLMAQQARADQYSKLYNDGVKELGEKRYREAVLLFNQALQLKPDYREAQFARGQCFLMLNERDKACVDFAISYKAGWEPAKEYLDKYCGKNAPGRTRKPLNATGK
jgi:hypothetical protein